MIDKVDFDEILTLLFEKPDLFSQRVKSDPRLLNLRWMGSETLLHFLITEGKYDQVKFLASLGADINVIKPNGGTPLHSAILSNDLTGVKLMLELGSDPYVLNKAGFDALEWAQFIGVDRSIIDLLKLDDKKRGGNTSSDRCDWV